MFHLQVNLGRLTHITGIATQGAEDSGSYVTEYKVLYSADAIKWEIYMENQQEKVSAAQPGIEFLLRTESFR